MKRYFFPQLERVQALAPYRLRTVWNTGETLDVDVGGALRAIPALAPILNPEVFATARIAEWGGSVEWFDTEFGADNLYAWAKEQSGQPSHEQFNAWMLRNDLDPADAAVALGVSRRLIGYYRTAQRPIPKTVWLACLGYDWLKQQAA
jgi:hypothetical protein